MTATTIHDQRGRGLGTLRLSLTDRCNLRCNYCMPEDSYRWVPREDCLSLEEYIRLVRVFAALDTKRFRITGGEPLLRRNIAYFVEQAQSLLTDDAEIAMTTNGVLLSEYAQPLFAAGLNRLTVSLDTLDPHRFAAFTKRRSLNKTLDGIAAAQAIGFQNTKINAVVIRGFNDDEIIDLLKFARTHDAELRYIEYMDVGGATGWSFEKVVPQNEILVQLRAHFGEVTPLPRGPTDTAQRFELDCGTRFGIIASTTAPFCAGCDRSRITPDGTWYHCLYAPKGLPMRAWLRNTHNPDASDAALISRISKAWASRSNQGAVDRLDMATTRGPLLRVLDLQKDPRLEMHTRGG